MLLSFIFFIFFTPLFVSPQLLTLHDRPNHILEVDFFFALVRVCIIDLVCGVD